MHKPHVAAEWGGAAPVDAIEKSAMRKIYLRLLPFAVLCYLLAYIDRINASFAALTMRGDLKLSAAEYGFAVGTFYWGYFIFEVPSNVVLEKVGARLWIARIMITWGIFAGLTALVGDFAGWTGFSNTVSLTIIRFLLGAAEAGFFPGIVLYFTYWFPTYHHARIVSGFLVGLPIAVAAGAPVSTALLGLNGLFGLTGWQIMYIAEGVPTIILGLVTFFVLTDKPTQATWLTEPEKSWLVAKLASERKAKEAVKKFSFLEGMYNPKVLLLSLNYFGIVVASLGILFFVPQMIKDIGVTNNMTVGWLTMIPYFFGFLGLVGWGYVSDRTGERRWNLLGACVVSTIGLVITGLTVGSWWSIVGLCISTFGFYGSKGPFWSMPPMFMTGTAAAAAIAWINSIGNLGGFFGPWYVGVIKDWTGNYSGGILGLAFLCVMSAVVCALFLEIPNPAAEARALEEATPAE
jgi:ACS family tartrate transporter-like MFS transporter